MDPSDHYTSARNMNRFFLQERPGNSERMHDDSFIFAIFLVFTGAAVFATLALYARQALIVSYIVLGMILGPWGLGLVTDANLISGISHIGIMFLLFLLGLDLPLEKLYKLVGETTRVTGISSVIFFLLGVGVAWLFGYALLEQLIVGAALMFSSTIIGLKLLPTTVLHHRRTGEVIISILLLQDLIAIVILLCLQLYAGEQTGWISVGLLVVSLPVLLGLAWVLERYVLIKLIRRFDTIQEYIFLMAIGWCLGFAQLAEMLGLSYEIGAFIAGVALATSPISLFIAESLRPLRDFFLIIFFFSLGAGFDLGIVAEVLLPALILSLIVLLIKPVVFGRLLSKSGEDSNRSTEVGVRLGQISEFSLLIAVLALNLGLISHKVSYLIQASTLLTFIVSSYLVVMRYPTPIAVSERLRRN